MAVQQPTVVSHFLERADSFFHAAFDLDQLNELEEGRFGQAIGLLAVHSTIALADAVLMAAAEGSTATGENHTEAARRLRKWCSARGIEGQGLRHFEWLLGKKNHFPTTRGP